MRGADEIKVRFHDGSELIAKDVKMDPRTDVALIRIDASNLKPLPLGDSRTSQVGDWVLAIGSPFGLEASVTAGIQAGDVIEKAGGITLNSVENYEKVKVANEDHEGLVLNIRSTNGRRFAVLKVD